jgi:hypothetical protein
LDKGNAKFHFNCKLLVDFFEMQRLATFGQRNQAQLDGGIGLSFAEIRDMICHGCGKKGHR